MVPAGGTGDDGMQGFIKSLGQVVHVKDGGSLNRNKVDKFSRIMVNPLTLQSPLRKLLCLRALDVTGSHIVLTQLLDVEGILENVFLPWLTQPV